MITRASDIKTYYLEPLWKDVLEAEGVGLLDLQNRKLNTKYEINNMYNALKRMCFFESTDDDIVYRKAFVLDRIGKTHDIDEVERDYEVPAYTFGRKATTLLLKLYESGLSRSVRTEDKETDDKLTELLDQYIADTNIHAMAIEYYKQARASGCAVVSVMHEDLEGRDTIRLMFNSRPSSEFRLVYDNEGKVEKYLFATRRIVDGEEQNVIEIWTDTERYGRDVFGKRFEIEGGNPYGFIPIVVMRDNKRYPYGEGMNDLVNECLTYNYQRFLQEVDSTYAAMNYTLLTNTSVGDGEATGNVDIVTVEGKEPRSRSASNAVRLSPRSVIAIERVQTEDVPPAIDIVSGEPHSVVLMDMADRIKMEALKNEGVSPAVLSDSVPELSGKAMQILDKELLTRREQDSTVFKQYEQELCVVIAKIANIADSAGLPERPELYNIDFVEPYYADQTPTEEYDLAWRMYRDGVISLVDLIQKYNPEITDNESALEFVKTNKSFQKRLAAMGMADLNTIQPAAQDAQNILEGQASDTGTVPA